MASTSASSTQKSFKYDVFLTFRGEDTRKNFVDHLYHALQQKGIVTCKDDEEIKKGKRISDELIRSIEESRFYIIVFSKNYASSSWCLGELVKIIECQKMSEHTAYPIFYDVEPNEVRKQSGAVGEAFAKHREEEAAWKWREALRKAADLSGWELKNTLNGHEAKFIQKIVEEISTGIRYISSSFDGKLIGMEMRVNDVVSSLETDIDDVRMIGIKGIGGGGKTTLAKAVFDQISILFDGSSFVENVRESSKASSCGFKSLQKQILSDVLNGTPISIHGFSDLKNTMKKIMYGRKVLIVLDDVDHIDQLEALAGDLNWFKPGSRIIITTRDEQILIAHGVPQNLILDVNLLSQEEANCLFNRYAFGRVIPNQGYEELACQVIRYAAGLPLTIKVLGSFLRKKSKLEWTDALERLKIVPLKKTLDILELSYNSLEEDYKEIFLDVTCMLKGWKKEEAIIALESCGFHARNGLKVLELKSLLTISDSECLGMHDHIEEMGHNIVRRLQPNEPNKHSRLWIKEEIKDILAEDKGTEAIRCMKVLMVDPVIVMKGLRQLKELRFLDVIWRGNLHSNSSDVNVDSDFYYQHSSKLDFADLDYIGKDNLYLPNGLQYLRWNGYPFTRLPKTFQANNLVGLKMHYSRINQLWEARERKVPKKLKFIDLSFCKLRSLDIGMIPNLERLSLINCDKLVELHMAVENSKLSYLDIYGSKLRTLDLEHAQNLDTLKVQLCCNLTELRMPIESLKLKHLTIHCSMLKALNLTQFRKLKTLNLAFEHLVEFHMPSENFKLKFLNLISFKIRTLDIGRARHLDNLNIKDNGDLAELHIPVDKLKHIRLRCSKMKTLNLMWTRNINTLDLSECVDLLEVHMPIESLEIETIKISCSKLRTLNLTSTRNLKRLDLEQCGDLLELHMPVENLGLKIIKICCSKLRTINLTGTRNLERLVLEQCEELVELHMPIESPNLKTINIRYSKLRTLNLAMSKNLERLDLEQCEDLVELHMPIESPKLKTIKIHCSKLRTLYLGLSPCLKSLDLNDCLNLVEIHAPVGCLSGCVTFKPVLVHQGFPMVGSLAELLLIARSLGLCPLHPENNLPKFHFEYTYKDLLPTSTGNLMKLLSFSLCACKNLASLSQSICGLQYLRKLTLEGSIPEVPKELDKLEYLQELTLLSTNIEYLPDNICLLRHLKILELISCCFLKQLPEDIGRLEYLEELRLRDCTSLQDIPNSICEMKCLKCFYLTNCILVKKLPKEIGRLKCLKELNIEGTGILDLPESIYQLEDLAFYL